MQETDLVRPVSSSLLASTSLPQEVVFSFVVPVMDEMQSVRMLFERLSAQLDQVGQCYEVFFIDDGSTDGTFNELKKLHDEYPGVVRVIRFRRNFGKTAALVAGFSRCQGSIIFTMDGDLQDDPQEISQVYYEAG